MSSTTKIPTSCCGKSGNQGCVCASQAKCKSHLPRHSSPIFDTANSSMTGSCGKQSALNCTCEKATTENTVAGARCSCRMSPIPYHFPLPDPILPANALEHSTDGMISQALAPPAHALVNVQPPRTLKSAAPPVPAANVQPVRSVPCQILRLHIDIVADACSCEKAPDGGQLPTEIDFTTKAAGA